MKKIKNFYKVCNPTETNKRTGNVCVNINDVAKFNKDFRFSYNVDGKDYDLILKKEWVRDNLKGLWGRGIRKDGSEYAYNFYVLRINDILMEYEVA